MTTGAQGKKTEIATTCLRAGAVLAGLLACSTGWAQSQLAQQVGQLDISGLPPKLDSPARVEVTSTQLPRLDAIDPTPSQRTSVTVLPPRDSAIGVALDVNGFNAPERPIGAGLAPAPQSSVDLGVHWRAQLDGGHRIDVTAWHRMTPQQPDAYALVQLQQQATFGARVELNLGGTENRKGLVADKGFVGVALDNSRSITVRRKDGHPMIYYRVKF